MKIYYNILFTGFLIFTTHVGYCGADRPSGDSSTAKVSSPISGVVGKVIETMNAGSYTYVRVDTGTNKIWIAAPRVEVKAGDSVVISDAMPMANYHSKILNRDFDVVYFTGNLTINGRSTTGSRAAELPKNHPTIAGSSPEPKIDLSGIKRAKGGKTIEEIFADKAKLGGHQVTVRGKVVKYNAMILGKNWVHLRDGTGAPGSNDLLVTTASTAKIGDTIVVSGVVSLNKDFGSNYKYDVMIEDAKLVNE